MRLDPFGDTAWRAHIAGGIPAAHGRALLEALRVTRGIVDAVVSEEHVLVVRASEGGGCEKEVARAVIEQVLASSPASETAPREHVVRVRYRGEDLGAVAQATGCSVEEVVRLHRASGYSVAAVGFLPGFAYLRGLDSRLVLPRRASPRPRVPRGSVAIAGPYSAVYPFASPGGWHLLGLAEGFEPFSPGSGAVMALGDRVRFEEQP